jgi:cell division ATPase FtsA
MSLLTNGYRVTNPEGEKAFSLEIAQATVVAQQYLIDAILEMHDKLFPTTKMQQVSFILMLHATLRDLVPKADELCLIDITYEATEIGIVRDGVLRYSTHIPFGMFSLARELAEISNQPLHESFAAVRSGNIDSIVSRLTEDKAKEVEEMLNVYVNKISELFHETGDTLSIPKHIALHIDHAAEPLFAELIKSATKRATHIEHVLMSVSEEIVDKEYRTELAKHVGTMCEDTALAVNATFFHKDGHGLGFVYH